VGLGAAVVPACVREWIVGIEDATELMRDVADLVARGDIEAAQRLLPAEFPYPLAPETVLRLGVLPPR
jgi:hypothetical protein